MLKREVAELSTILLLAQNFSGWWGDSPRCAQRLGWFLRQEINLMSLLNAKTDLDSDLIQQLKQLYESRTDESQSPNHR